VLQRVAVCCSVLHNVTNEYIDFLSHLQPCGWRCGLFFFGKNKASSIVFLQEIEQ